MGFCPYYSKSCPQNDECQLWDVEANQCGIIKQKNVLQQILETGGETSVVSLPPQGKYKVTNIYVDPVSGRLTVNYDDTPAS